ncbi:MAG TPA: hypothetical protein VGL55_12100 [Steroidobacteraceae bacterium]
MQRLTGACDFAFELAECPLRYVLDDDLISGCTALAYSDGDQLAGCLDLVYIPAARMWVEWSERARREELARLPGWAEVPSSVLRAGVLISGDAGGRSGRLRTFWVTREAPEEPCVASVETLLDLDCTTDGAAAEGLLHAGPVGLGTCANAHVHRLFQCARFRLDPLWGEYYRNWSSAPDAKTIVRCSLAAVASDIPMLLGFFLLLAVRASLHEVPVDLARLNRKRARLGKRALLEHIEVSSPLFAGAAPWSAEDAASGGRRGPRYHHVRGHLVRRRGTIYWRAPHWRGHVRLGSIRTRTVALGVSREQTASANGAGASRQRPTP